MLRRIFRKLHKMNMKIYTKCALADCSSLVQMYTYICIFKKFYHVFIYSAIRSRYIPQNITIQSAVIFLIFLQSFNRKQKKIDKI